MGDYVQAETHYQQALAIQRTLLGEQHPDIATSLNNLAVLYGDTGNYAQAESLSRQALAMRRAVFGEVHPEVAASLNNLAALYASMGDYAQAEPLYRQAVEIWRTSVGEGHPNVATSLSNLASLHESMGDYVLAEPLLEQALVIRRTALGEQHPDTTASLNNLAVLYVLTGRYDKAEPLLEQALAIRRATLGEEHPATAESLTNLANLYYRQDRYPEVEPLYQRALAIDEQVYGAEHPEVANDLNNLAQLYRAQGRYTEAEPLYQRALAIYEQQLGAEHSETAISLNNLAELYHAQGKYEQAEPLYQRALLIREQHLGAEHLNTAQSLNNLAQLYRAQGRYTEAEPLYQRALAIREQLRGPEHPDVATSLNNLAELYKDMGEYSQAEPLYQQALAIWQAALGEQHLQVVGPLIGLANLYREQGKYVEAELLYQRALRIREQQRPIDPITTAISAALDAGALSGLTQMSTTAIKDAYQALKGLLSKKFGARSNVVRAIAHLEARPESAGRQAGLAEEITAVQAEQDSEVLATATHLLTLVQPQQAGMGKFTIQNNAPVQGQNIGDYQQITQYFGDQREQATTLRQLGNIAQNQGDYEQARRFYQQSLNISERLDDQREAASVQHQLDILDSLMQQRYVNVSIVRQEDRKIVAKTTSLGVSRTYALRLNIGPLLNESVVQNADQYPFPVQLLPPTNIGYWLEVIVVSDDFVVPFRQHHLFLPRLGSSWECDCPPGKNHQCSENERQPYLFVPIQTPELPGIAQLRIAIYYQRNLIQSQLLTAKIVEMEQRGEGHSSIIDYTLTSDLRDLSFLPPRTLHILTNDNADGSHRIVINGEGDDVLAFNLTEGQIRVTIEAAREALRNVHFEEYGGTLGSRRQRRNLLDSKNAKTREAFIKDLARLAPLGWKLWTLLLKDRLEWRKMLLAPATIQVSRTISSTLAFPWALVYDIPLDSQGQHKVCPLIENWNENKGLIDLSVYCCPHESTHGLKNTICPFGFWGFRHAIEQPPSMPSGRNLPVLIHMTNHPPELVVGLSQSLDKDQTAKHLQVMKNQLTLFTVQDRTSLEGIIAALADPVEVVYFYCHGGREPLVGTSQHTPYLQVGEDERFQPSDITTWRVADWPENHWEQTSPLVFINGCHTVELTPELLVNFVDAFSTAYAAGVIGTEISIEQGIAAEAAEHFFNTFQQGKTVGQALQQMRLHFLAQGNLLGLAYTPYCSASLHL
jgi:tetratricopeptide (TPR) repeat protein